MSRKVSWLLLTGLLLVLAGCRAEAFSYPPAATLSAAPEQVSVEQIQAEYGRDAAAAGEEYTGKQFYFGKVTVDRVEKEVYPLRAPEEYILSGDVQFKPAYRGMLNEMVPGSVVEVSGWVEGKMPWGYIVVRDCWLKLVSGGSTVVPGY